MPREQRIVRTSSTTSPPPTSSTVAFWLRALDAELAAGFGAERTVRDSFGVAVLRFSNPSSFWAPGAQGSSEKWMLPFGPMHL